jgi:hypothetical protein
MEETGGARRCVHAEIRKEKTMRIRIQEQRKAT